MVGESFAIDEQLYRGCLVTVAGDWNRARAAGIADLLEDMRADPGSRMALAGWRRDLAHDADGPDGTAFRLERSGVFCAVAGWWDGGDDSEPGRQASPLYLVEVRCARR
jgi:hypothetical protein